MDNYNDAPTTTMATMGPFFIYKNQQYQDALDPSRA